MNNSNLAFANGAANREAPLELIGALLKSARRTGHPARSITTSGPGPLPRPAEARTLTPGSPAIPDTARVRLAQLVVTDFPLLLQSAGTRGSHAAALQIHLASPRARRPFAAVNCAALSEEALELELFGYDVRIGFDGRHIKAGAFERCRGGTVFLEHINALPSRLQARLLDLVDDKRLSRVGGDSWVETDTRILIGSSMDAEMALEAGTLRKDLYYRLHKLAI